jgi:DNA polymerase-3 subunit gamma/tau
VEAPLALYRRYRPDRFDEVIGQSHVTGPLSNALDHNRVNHAYLFSGPRGCGKTTSARILARALNCEQGPTSTPCGTCQSCRDLARGGPGSIDVMEIDAASHGGVDDARDLRERAFFAPVQSRYKVYIIDEAHMVTAQGFNALLKLVEEPPSHLRFVFATTEPDKVIGTIRSRTHHYPFRLIPPKVMGDYLIHVCEQEQVAIEPTVVPLIVRAGAGSARDSLSVLDQLIGGAGADGITHALATALLGYTPDALLDEIVDALAAQDGNTVFGVVDKVIESGQDPRRFAEDLLQRFRDLVITTAVPDAAAKGLIQVSDDQADRLSGQASRFGPAELTRAADVLSEALTEMRGAIAPRLLFEITCARLLLPGADGGHDAMQARLDRVERRLSLATNLSGSQEPAGAGAQHVEAPRADALMHDDLGTAAVPHDADPTPEVASSHPQQAPDGRRSTDGDVHGTSVTEGGRTADGLPEASVLDEPGPGGSASAPGPDTRPRREVHGGRPGGAPALTLVDLRHQWPDILSRVRNIRRFTWVMLNQNTQLTELSDGVLTITLVNSGARESFIRSGSAEVLRQVLNEQLGVDWTIETLVEGAAPVRTGRDDPDEPRTAVQPSRRTEVTAVKQEIRSTRTDPTDVLAPNPEDAAATAPDDELVDDGGVTRHELLARELGAEVIEEIRHQP